MRSLTRIYKLVLLSVLNAITLFAGVLIRLLPKSALLPARAKGMSIWARCACSILGIRTRRTGMNCLSPSALIVANHSSYLDILVLGSLIPGVFVAKREIASWPLLGRLTRLAGTILVDRGARMSARSTALEIERSLSSGVHVLLFPEGTTNNGVHILDFKSSFFKVPVEGNKHVQPVSLVYSHIDGSPVSQEEKDRIAWYGDMTLLPHLWNVLGMKRIDVRVHCNPAVSCPADIDSPRKRKLVSSMARKSVIAGCAMIALEITSVS